MAIRGIDDPEPHWRMVRLALASPADTTIIPAQDLLGLGADARMNTPGTDAGNWTWQLAPDALDARLAERLRAASVAAGRSTPAAT